MACLCPTVNHILTVAEDGVADQDEREWTIGHDVGLDTSDQGTLHRTFVVEALSHSLTQTTQMSRTLITGRLLKPSDGRQTSDRMVVGLFADSKYESKFRRKKAFSIESLH